MGYIKEDIGVISPIYGPSWVFKEFSSCRS